MSRTRTFEEYIVFLKELIEEDPLFLRYNLLRYLRCVYSSGVQLKGNLFQDIDIRCLVPESNMLYLVGGDSQSFINIVSSFLTKKVTLEQKVSYEAQRHPHPPRKQYCWRVNDGFTSASMVFETGKKPREKEFVFSAKDDFHHETPWTHKNYVGDGKLNIHTMAIVTSYVALPKIKEDLRILVDFYNHNEVISFRSGREKIKTTIGEFINDFYLTEPTKGYNTRAEVDLTIKIMEKIIQRKIPASLSQANQPRIFAVNQVPLKY